MSVQAVPSEDMPQWVYRFGAGSADGSADMRNLLGGKGANLAEMSLLGLPVPPGFTITTEVCTAFYDNDRNYPSGLKEQVSKALENIGELVGHKLGDPTNPLLVSVRSGARASMPGHDGHCSKFGTERHHRCGLGKNVQRRTVRLRLLSSLHSNVLRRGFRSGSRSL